MLAVLLIPVHKKARFITWTSIFQKKLNNNGIKSSQIKGGCFSMKTVSHINLRKQKEKTFTCDDRIMLFITKFHLKAKRDKWLTLRLLLRKGSADLVEQILISSEYRRDFPELLEDETVRDFYLDLKNPKKEMCLTI
jgi:hypothetical protein